MLLGGLWHGAAWTFVVWGGLHGTYLAVERILVAKLRHQTIWQKWLPRLFLGILTYFLINITWVFFRAEDFTTAMRMIDTMLRFDISGEKVLTMIEILKVSVVISIMLLIHWFMRDRQLHEIFSKIPGWFVGLIWGIPLWLIIITQGESNAFIYLQF